MSLAILTLAVLPALTLHQDDEPTLQLGVDLAAIAGKVSVSFAELDEVLIWRHGRSPNGREALRSLLDLTVLEHLAAEAGVEVGPKLIAARWTELETEVQEAGVAVDLLDYLAQNEIDPETFRNHLRLSIVHEELTRRALGIASDTPITGEQQTQWLQGVLLERTYEELPHPWSAGVVARTGELEVGREDFALHLRALVTKEEQAEVCHALALEKALLARMPDLAESAVGAAVDAEIERRRERVEADPRYKGIKYEELLEAQGLSLDAVRRDPGLRVHAISHLWSSRTHDDASLREAYETERELFDARHGEAIDVYSIFLRAARFKNALNPRNYDEADASLKELQAKIAGLDDFRRLATQFTEEQNSKENQGYFGRITAGMSTVPGAMRTAAFDAIEAARNEDGVADLTGTVLGPLRVQGGSLLLCLGQRYPAPTWEQMAFHVSRELRRRMRDEVLPRTAVAIWFDK
ncbi:MAG: peptidylprolyl isomerase [Planctomycetota bacterium]|nr:peptidylprolyl isomerase [Planctomycetota bacterium]